MTPEQRCAGDDVPICRAMYAWNPIGWTGFKGMTPGDVGVCNHPDRGELKDLACWNAPFQDVPERPMKPNEAKIVKLQLQMMIDAWYMAYMDGVPLKNIHAALSRIPEYRDLFER